MVSLAAIVGKGVGGPRQRYVTLFFPNKQGAQQLRRQMEATLSTGCAPSLDSIHVPVTGSGAPSTNPANGKYAVTLMVDKGCVEGVQKGRLGVSIESSGESSA